MGCIIKLRQTNVAWLHVTAGTPASVVPLGWSRKCSVWLLGDLHLLCCILGQDEGMKTRGRSF